MIGGDGAGPRRAHTAQANREATDDTKPRPQRPPEWRVAGERGHLIIERNYHHNPWNVATGCGEMIQPSAKDSTADIKNYPLCGACEVVAQDQGIPRP